MNIRKIKIIIAISFILLNTSSLYSQNEEDFSDKMSTNSRYISSEDGILRVYINVWGNVNSPGRLIVDDGVDILTAISLAGGPSSGANLSKVKLYREQPDSNGNSVYTINIDQYISTGDRNQIINIRPNDTIIIPEKTSAFFLKNLAPINTLMTILNLYFSVKNN